LKALSIEMPWAYLIACGIKDVEDRTWPTEFRGRIYIHAGKSFDKEALKSPKLRRIEKGGLIDLQTGWAIAKLCLFWEESAIIGEVDIVDCVTQSRSPWFEGPYGFVLANPIMYKRYLPCKGRLRFFTPSIRECKLSAPMY